MTILFQKKASGKLHKWSIRVDGPYVITSYGYVGGAMQSTRETAEAMNVGRSNEISAEDQAVLIAERKIKEKLDNGYSATPEEAEQQDLGAEVNFDSLPVSFCPAKPISEITDDKLRALWDSGRAIVQRKFDGLCHFYVTGSEPHLLSRGKLEEKTSHVPHIAQALHKLPPGTVLNGEVCLNPEVGDDFKHVTSVLRCKDPEKALAKQKSDGILHYIIFDVLFWGGEDVTGMKYVDRIKLFSRWSNRHARANHGAFSMPLNLALHRPYDNLFGEDNLAKQLNFEGYIVWDALENTQVRWDGKTARKNCYKWKPVHTEDVVVKNPSTGKGRNENRLGKVEGYQYHEGKLIHIGDIGGGLSDKQREDFWIRRDEIFPCVWEIEAAERLPSMKLRFPVFKRIRDDKLPSECVSQLMPRSRNG